MPLGKVYFNSATIGTFIKKNIVSENSVIPKLLFYKSVGFTKGFFYYKHRRKLKSQNRILTIFNDLCYYINFMKLVSELHTNFPNDFVTRFAVINHRHYIL